MGCCAHISVTFNTAVIFMTLMHVCLLDYVGCLGITLCKLCHYITATVVVADIDLLCM